MERIKVHDSVLANLLVSPGLIADSPGFRTDLFPDDLKEIVTVLMSRFEEGSDIDAAIISSTLTTNKDMPYSLITQAATARHEEYYNLVVDHWEKTQMQYFCDKMKDIAMVSKPREVAHAFEKFTTDLFEQKADAGKTIGDDVNNKLAEIKAVADGVVEPSIRTGIRCIDDYNGGWFTGEYFVCAARPGVGKTSLTIQALVEIAKRGIPVGLVSCEMDSDKVLEVAASQISKVPRTRVRKGTISPDEYMKMAEAMNELRDLPFYILDNQNVWENILDTLRMWKRKHGVKVVVFDYLQLMTLRDFKGEGYREYTKISNNILKHTKKNRLNIASVVLSQVRRSNRDTNRPMMQDLKETGAIEQDAHSIMFLWPPDPPKTKRGGKPVENVVDLSDKIMAGFAKARAGSDQDRDKTYRMRINCGHFSPSGYEKDDTPPKSNESTFITPRINKGQQQAIESFIENERNEERISDPEDDLPF